MLRVMLALMMAASLFSPQSRTIFAMKTGVLLRMHVVAQDDTAEMQRVKLRVRDAVLSAYSPEEPGPMLMQAAALLPQLTSAARDAAAREGFTGQVHVSLENRDFDACTLDGMTFPAGKYPALMVRLGDAKGHNWWGLLDAGLALDCAGGQDGSWDWSLAGLLKALFRWNLGVTCHE